VKIDACTAIASQTSLSHTHNQDTVGILNLNMRSLGPTGAWVLSDGMGGHLSGEQASRLAVQGFLDHFLSGCFDFTEFSENWVQYLEHLVSELDTELYDTGFSGEAFHRDPHRSLMGATFTGALRLDNSLFLVHVGDTRCYLLRNHILQQLTVDHITSNGKYLTQALGSGDIMQPFTSMFEIEEQDRLILLSDGVYRALELQQIRAILETADESENIVRCLVRTASEATGFADDASALLVSFLASRKHRIGGAV